MKLTGKQCLYRACNEVFSTEANFNRHRKGRHGIDRHCVSPDTVGLLKSDRGIWRMPPRADGR